MNGLPPQAQTTSSGSTSTLRVLREVVGHRLAQLRDTRRGRVAGLALGDRPDAGQADVLRRGEVGLADAEGDDVLALRRPVSRPRRGPRTRSRFPVRLLVSTAPTWLHAPRWFWTNASGAPMPAPVVASSPGCQTCASERLYPRSRRPSRAGDGKGCAPHRGQRRGARARGDDQSRTAAAARRFSSSRRCSSSSRRYSSRARARSRPLALEHGSVPAPAPTARGARWPRHGPHQPSRGWHGPVPLRELLAELAARDGPVPLAPTARGIGRRPARTAAAGAAGAATGPWGPAWAAPGSRPREWSPASSSPGSACRRRESRQTSKLSPARSCSAFCSSEVSETSSPSTATIRSPTAMPAALGGGAGEDLADQHAVVPTGTEVLAQLGSDLDQLDTQGGPADPAGEEIAVLKDAVLVVLTLVAVAQELHALHALEVLLDLPADRLAVNQGQFPVDHRRRVAPRRGRAVRP